MCNLANGHHTVIVPVELRFEDAMRILPQCSLSLFQPMELFPLFPSVTAPWADQLPRKGYWGMHRPLPALDALLAGEAQPQTRTLLEQEAMQSIAEYLLEVSHLCLLQVPRETHHDPASYCTKWDIVPLGLCIAYSISSSR